MRTRRWIVGAVVVTALVFLLFSYFAWRTKYARAKTVNAVAIDEVLVFHQRAYGWRSPLPQDRLVAVDAESGRELARTTVLRGELLGTRGAKLVYAIGDRLVLFNPATLESTPSPDRAEPARAPYFGAQVYIGEDVLVFDIDPETDIARVRRMTRDRTTTAWVIDLPWKGNDLKLVSLLGEKLIIVDADGAVGMYRRDGIISWIRH